MPFVQANIPVFVSLTAIVCLGEATGLIEDSLAVFDNQHNNIDALTQLQTLQDNWRQLDNILKDQCAHANAIISNSTALAFRHSTEYHRTYGEISSYYGSLEFSHARDVLTTLKIKIIELTNCGCVTDNSYKPNGDLITKVSDYVDEFKQAFYKWNRDYFRRQPRFPID